MMMICGVYCVFVLFVLVVVLVLMVCGYNCIGDFEDKLLMDLFNDKFFKEDVVIFLVLLVDCDVVLFDVGGCIDLLLCFVIDLKLVLIGKDNVVCYIVLIISKMGVCNVNYEGLCCDMVE